jgi:hypothetical protein
MESLLLRLLKAVLMPITMKYLGLPADSEALYSSETGEPFRNDSCSVLAAESSDSKFDIVLSKDLQQVEPFELSQKQLPRCFNGTNQRSGRHACHHILHNVRSVQDL